MHEIWPEYFKSGYVSGCLGWGISGKRVCPGTGEESLLAVIYVRILKGTWEFAQPLYIHYIDLERMY